MRLNGWQRIGVIASVVWALGIGGYWWTADMESINHIAALSYSNCTELNQYRADKKDCALELKPEPDWWKAPLGDAAIVALGPIPFAWGIVYALLGLTRWVRRGFQNA